MNGFHPLPMCMRRGFSVTEGMVFVAVLVAALSIGVTSLYSKALSQNSWSVSQNQVLWAYVDSERAVWECPPSGGFLQISSCNVSGKTLNPLFLDGPVPVASGKTCVVRVARDLGHAFPVSVCSA